MNRLAQSFLTRSVRTKLFLLTMIIMVASFGLIGYQQTKIMTTLIEGEALAKARSDLQTGMEIIDMKYPGAWRAEGDKLYKGEELINNNFEIVDEIGRLTNGNTATIFLHDVRITTNVIADGERALGTEVSSEVAEKVLKQGEIYLGQANVVGHTYQSAYMPIKDARGEIIGIWYVGAPDADERIS